MTASSPMKKLGEFGRVTLWYAERQRFVSPGVYASWQNARGKCHQRRMLWMPRPYKRRQRSSDRLLEDAWGLIATAYGGDWETAWRAAAIRWRAAYFEHQVGWPKRVWRWFGQRLRRANPSPGSGES